MANLEGWLSTSEGNQESRIYDISREISVLSDFKPFVFNLGLQRALPSHDPRFQWDEVDYSSALTAINNSAGYSDTDTSLVVDDASLFTVMDLVRNLRTEEVYQVITVTTSTNTITVLRKVGDTSGVAILDDDPLLIIGPAFEEASDAPDSNVANTTTEYNFVQTFRTRWNISGTKQRTMSTPGMGMEDISRRKADEFLRSIEYSIIFGKRSENTTDFDEVRRTTNGITNIISTNVEAVGGTLTEDAWNEFLAEKVFLHGSDEKFFVCGQIYFTCLSKYGRGYLQTELEDNLLGVYVSTYICPTGERLHLYNHNLLRGSSYLAGLGIAVDPNEIRMRYTENPGARGYNGQIQYIENDQPKGKDGYSNEYFAEMGLELRNEASHAMITGVTGPA